MDLGHRVCFLTRRDNLEFKWGCCFAELIMLLLFMRSSAAPQADEIKLSSLNTLPSHHPQLHKAGFQLLRGIKIHSIYTNFPTLYVQVLALIWMFTRLLYRNSVITHSHPSRSASPITAYFLQSKLLICLQETNLMDRAICC